MTAPDRAPARALPSGAHDFDFLTGRWRVRNRRLRERLAGCNDWDEFDAVSTCRPILDGLGNQDEFRTDFWPGFIGMSFRFFDPASRRWAIYWADSVRGRLEPPVYGVFDGDQAIFEGDDRHAGRAVRVRFVWSGVTGATPRWQQAFSADGGQSWETNWIMDFHRVD